MHARNNPSYSQLQARCRTRYEPSIAQMIQDSWPITLLGVIMFCGGLYLIVWNEGRVVRLSRALESALTAVVVLQRDSKPSEDNNGRLVLLAGELTVGEPLTEIEYGVAVQTVKLKRRVQMLQWVQEERRVELLEGDQLLTDVQYNYDTEWRDKLVDSSRFVEVEGHENPKSFPLKSKVYVSEYVAIGPFQLGPELKAQFNDFVAITSDERPEQRDIKLHAGLYYHSRDVWAPEVGDIRVQFSYAGHAGFPFTVVGKQVDGVIRPYHMAPGVEVATVRPGVLSAEEVFWMEHSNNRWIAWSFRLGGWLLAFLGCNSLSNIVTVLDVSGETPCLFLMLRNRIKLALPWLEVYRHQLSRELLAASGSTIPFMTATTSCLLAIALTWLWLRPLMAVALIVSATVPVAYAALRHAFASGDVPPPDSYRRLPD